MNNAIKFLKAYCAKKGLSSLSITIKRKDKVGPDGYEVSIEKKFINEVVKEGKTNKSKIRVKIVKTGI